MLRVLQCVNNMHRAGIETMLMNYYRNIDRTKIQFDFLTHRPFRSDYDDEIESLGGKVYYAPRLTPQNYPAYFSYMKNFFKEHPEYKIVHSHIDAMSYLPLLAAKKSNIPIRIAHSHSTRIDKDYKYLLKQYYRARMGKVATCFAACGKAASEFLFKNDDAFIVPNAVQGDRFLFDQTIRNDLRKEMDLENQFVVGHVGRFTFAKNHGFLIDIFKEIVKIQPNAVLLLIGTGENERKIKDKVQQQGLSQNVRFLGVRSDVAQLYQVMDAFVLPSFFEGVPVVGVEAQFADLPCFFSSTVTKEVEFSDKCQFIGLSCSAKEWARIICATDCQNRQQKQYLDSGYRIENATQILEQFYQKVLKSEGLNLE